MTRVLVTGATGFLGRHTCAAFAGRALVRATSRRVAREGPWQEVVVADLGDPLPPAMFEGVDAVVHLAAVVHRHDIDLDDDGAYMGVNVEGTRRVCEGARRAGVRRVVLASSVSVLPERPDSAVAEDERPAPASAYARSKHEAEVIVREHTVEPVVLRFPLIYGPGLPGNLARMVVAVAARRFPPVPRVPNRRSMIHVEDAAHALVLAALDPRAAGRTYTVTDGRAYATCDVLAWICAALGRSRARMAPPEPVFRALATVGEVWTRVTGRRALFDRDAYRKLLGSAEYEAGAIGRELAFIPRRTLPEAMPEIVESLVKGVRSPRPPGDIP